MFDLRETIDNTVDEMISGNNVGFDLVSLSILYPNVDNARKIADYLLKKGYYEQYSAMLLLNNELNLNEEFERVKAYDKVQGYLAIANYVPYEDMIYCQSKVVENGKCLDMVKFLLNVKNCNKIEIIEKIVNECDVRSLAYVVKYIDDFTYELIEKCGLLGKIEQIITKSNNSTAIKILIKSQHKHKKDNNYFTNSMNNMQINERCKV
ncbi:MAG: hypothetical protein ACI4TX_03335 [Christensenellales bacterium]